MKDRAIRVLVVEDTRSVALALQRILGDFDVVGVAATGREALAAMEVHRPHVVTMDLNLPDAEGLSLTETVVARYQTAIIVVSAQVTPEAQRLAFDALRAGAYEVVSKARLLSGEGATQVADRLVRLVRTAGRRRLAEDRAAARAPAPAAPTTGPRVGRPEGLALVAIGASTGGPPAVRQLLQAMPLAVSPCVLLAQHMADGFMEGLARWLEAETPYAVRIARDRQALRPGAVFLPPSGYHLALGAEGALRLQDSASALPCPSVDVLFESVAAHWGAGAVCVLLTGMGSDGAAGLLAARKAGVSTAIQDAATAVVYGMPGSALSLGATDTALPPAALGEWIEQQLRGQATTGDRR